MPYFVAIMCIPLTQTQISLIERGNNAEWKHHNIQLHQILGQHLMLGPIVLQAYELIALQLISS